MGSRWQLFSVVGVVSLLGCQSVLGFEDFTPESETAEDDDQPVDAATEDDDTSNPSEDDDDTSNASDDDEGSAGEGVACGGQTECESGLVCLYGFCRPACDDDTECNAGRECLHDGNSGGCRLASETCDETQRCANADLVCGLDGVCRVDCKERSCDASTQRCIAGTCVSTVGEGAADWDCGAVEDGEVVCSANRLAVCNVLEPGLADVESCDNASVCEASLPANGRYDSDAPPTCTAACAAGSVYCDGATLLLCNDDGSGPIDEGETCATSALCDASVSEESATCLEPACAEDEVKCAGGQTELLVQTCNDARTGFDDVAVCDGATAQCNAGASACFDLDIDIAEVSMAEYQDWLGSNPGLDVQPSGCSWNDTFAPAEPCMADPGVEVADAQPQVCVDWCDASAFCAAQGRRLCGRIAGGMNGFDAFDDPNSSQWMNACTAGGQFEWTTGQAPTPDPIGCVHSGSQVTTPYAVGSHANCRSPSPGYRHLRDLSGNVEEWEDSCEVDASSASADENDACRTRGGSFESSRNETRCDAVPASAKVRSAVSPTLGFRCCG